MTYEVSVEVRQDGRPVTRLVLAPMSAKRLIEGAKDEFENAAKFLRGCIRADVENQRRENDDSQDA